MRFSGQTHIYGDHVNTDVIIPARYLNTSDPEELKLHCMEDIDQDFLRRVQPGDILVAGRNFGCGSSREHAPIAFRACGVACVIAESFARIFYRNSINIGLPVLECPEAVADIQPGDHLTVDVTEGIILNDTRRKTYHVPPFPDFMQELILCGGLVEYIKAQII